MCEWCPHDQPLTIHKFRGCGWHEKLGCTMTSITALGPSALFADVASRRMRLAKQLALAHGKLWAIPSAAPSGTARSVTWRVARVAGTFTSNGVILKRLQTLFSCASLIAYPRLRIVDVSCGSVSYLTGPDKCCTSSSVPSCCVLCIRTQRTATRKSSPVLSPIYQLRNIQQRDLAAPSQLQPLSVNPSFALQSTSATISKQWP